jgi:lysozyme
MRTSTTGRAKLAAREGVRLRAYRCSAGVLTIGVGHTSAAGAPAVTPGMVITKAECDAIFARDLVKYEAAVTRAVKVSLSASEFDSLVSLCYNIGPGAFARSAVVRRLNAGDRRGAADAFLAWNKGGGRVLPGLVTRRRSERVQFLTPYADPGPVYQKPAPKPDEPPAEAPAAPAPETPAPAAPGGFFARIWAWLSAHFSIKRRADRTVKGAVGIAGAGVAAEGSAPKGVLQWIGEKSVELKDSVSELVGAAPIFSGLFAAVCVGCLIYALWSPIKQDE